MPKNQNRSDQGSTPREPQSDPSIEDRDEEGMDGEAETESREPQSGRSGAAGGKKGNLKPGQTEEGEGAVEPGQHVETGAEEDDITNDRPGGDSRVSLRADDRNDGKPDEPMPSLDGSRTKQ
jgi:hypothetical protein